MSQPFISVSCACHFQECMQLEIHLADDKVRPKCEVPKMSGCVHLSQKGNIVDALK